VEVPLSALTRGRGRLDACRFFYEMLVLQNRGLARLRQDEPYADLMVQPDLAAMAVA
jgi:chromatin segregation and condensation protein Rec8/ScpA/Scc1 (kleisin family)